MDVALGVAVMIAWVEVISGHQRCLKVDVVVYNSLSEVLFGCDAEKTQSYPCCHCCYKVW